MKIIRDFLRILLGITFIFSGFVKGIDPLGTTYKFTDYFNAFGTEWATAFSFTLAILQAIAEFGIGVALLLNYRTKLFSWFSLIFMVFFLPLTLWIALKNPVTDCGCFGDALILTNWETFYKNVVLTAIAVLVFIYRNEYKNRVNIRFQHSYMGLIMILFGVTMYYSYNHLPIIDFRPYKISTNIIEGMEIPADAPQDEYKTTFVYKSKNTGEEKEFDETNYPWQDTDNWQYVSSESKLVKEGYHAPIHDFTIENEYGEDIKDFYLLDPNYTFILVAYNLDKYKAENQDAINTLAQEALNRGMNFFCLTASTEDLINEFKEEYLPPYEFFACDEITLKTIIRSTPGLVLTKDGTIIDKWHWRDIPQINKIDF